MTTGVAINDVEQTNEVEACYPVLKQLRPHLGDIGVFVEQISRQRAIGYRLSAAWLNGVVTGAVGYSLQENLLYGRFVYVDDLVVDETVRSSGVGAKLLSHARGFALASDCQYFVLDTGLQKALAQRFYFRQGLLSHSIGFFEKLGDSGTAPRSMSKI